jgi:hypothetical protein
MPGEIASAVATTLALHVSLQIAFASLVLPDACLNLAVHSDGAVTAYAYPCVRNRELRAMSTLREHVCEVGRAHYCVWTRMLVGPVDRVKRMCCAAGTRALCAKMIMQCLSYTM